MFYFGSLAFSRVNSMGRMYTRNCARKSRRVKTTTGRILFNSNLITLTVLTSHASHAYEEFPMYAAAYYCSCSCGVIVISISFLIILRFLFKIYFLNIFFCISLYDIVVFSLCFSLVEYYYMCI